MQPGSAGRSRGRARTSTGGAAAPQPGAVPATPVVPAAPPGSHLAQPVPVPPPPLLPLSQAMQPGDIGRGRGFTTETTTTTTTISTSPGGTGSPHSSESPTESPPQQHSPTSQTAVGRAALRGSTHPLPGSGPRTDLIGEAARLTLQESDLQAAATAKREYGRIEAVIVTKPANCTTKMGNFDFLEST
jgi:hypothetical protein